MPNLSSAPFSYDNLDKIIHERARLAILTSLSAHDSAMKFADLKTSCGLSDGNLSRHLQVLQVAGLVEIDKYFDKLRPVTTCKMTKEGQQRFLDYINILEQIIRDAALARQHIPKGLKPAKP